MSEHGGECQSSKREDKYRINRAVTLEEVGQFLNDCMQHVDDPGRGARDCLDDLIKSMHQNLFPNAWADSIQPLEETATPASNPSLDILARIEIDMISAGEIITAASYQISETHSLTCDHLKAARALLDQCVERVPKIHRAIVDNA